MASRGKRACALACQPESHWSVAFEENQANKRAQYLYQVPRCWAPSFWLVEPSEPRAPRWSKSELPRSFGDDQRQRLYVCCGPISRSTECHNRLVAADAALHQTN